MKKQAQIIKKDDENSIHQARLKLEKIIKMVRDLESNSDERNAALQTISEDALSVEVYTGYRILLCCGGPEVRIIGDLGKHGKPKIATLEYRDWHTPWHRYDTTEEELSVMLRYVGYVLFWR